MDEQFIWSAYANIDGCLVAIFVIYTFDFVNGPKISIVHEPGEEIFIKGKLASFLQFFSRNTAPVMPMLLKASKMLVPIISDKINSILWILRS